MALRCRVRGRMLWSLQPQHALLATPDIGTQIQKFTNALTYVLIYMHMYVDNLANAHNSCKHDKMIKRIAIFALLLLTAMRK